MNAQGPIRVDSVLAEVLEQHGVKEQVERMGVLELWPELVGEHVAEVTRAKGVSDATLFVVLNIYRNAFQYGRMGYASTLAWELFLIIVGFTIMQFVISRRWVYYEEGGN